ncbi:ATP-binding protein [Rhodococcus sp. NPDC057297]|uniref:ATP-binding protein n=1 Tax=Rhodococcus sp. NPDC057297 TaxID=3346090 RepID=UPI00363ACB89
MNINTLEMVHIDRDRWAWAARVPVLPDSMVEEELYGLDTVRRAYLNLAEALAYAAAEGSALQLRLHSAARSASHPGTVSAWIVGAATTVEDAKTLGNLVVTNLPAELDLLPASGEDTTDLFWFLTQGGAHPDIAEVRRRLEDADVGRSADPTARDATHVAVLQWAPEPHALRRAVEMLSYHEGRCGLILHAERTVPSVELLGHLSDTVALLRFDPDRRTDKLGDQILMESIEVLRDLPRAALKVRVAAVSTNGLLPGMVESIGMDLTGLGGFDIVRPSGLERFDAEELLTLAVAHDWGFDLTDKLVRELVEISSPSRAGAVVRFPQPPVGGLPGIASSPLTTLPRSPQLQLTGSNGPACILGVGLTGGTVELSLSEINRHVMLAGLPGFGKTTSVQRLLEQLWLDHRVPFLVLDPAKSDYADLAARLADDGVEHVVLGPAHPAFNPFVVPPGCDTAAHAARVVGAFDVALRLSESWPFGYILLSRALYKCYETSEAPTLRDFYRTVGDMIRTSDYSPNTRSEIIGSLLGRLESLVRGPMGSAFATGPDAGIDWERLLSTPTVVEFRAFAGPTERSLVFALLIAGLASYREAHPPAGRLAHVTVLEEAHRVLSSRSDSQSEGVRLLVEAVAELRGSGEGFIICDQAPSTLDATLRKVIGSLICHRIVDSTEREMLGNALLLNERQAQDLARLDVGTAVVYAAERVQSAMVQVSPPTSRPPSLLLTSRHSLGSDDVHPVMCIGCPSMCTGLDYATSRLRNHPADDGLIEDVFAEYNASRITRAEAWCTAGHVVALEPASRSSRHFLKSLTELASAMDTLAPTRSSASTAHRSSHGEQ